MKDSIAKFADSSITSLDTVIGGGGKCKAKSGSKKTHKTNKSNKTHKSNKSSGGCCSPCC